jgi:adenine-specific DNA-methyltransferase
MTKAERMTEGIFFTPKKVRDLLFQRLDEVAKVNIVKRILEPSFGSGEFLLDSRRIFPESFIVGVEKNSKLAAASPKIPNSRFECADFLEWSQPAEEPLADLIIGNPPYFVMKSDEVPTNIDQSECMVGRPNIYIAFLYQCLKKHLAENGHLAFIIPTSLYNAAYYKPMREWILKNTTVQWLETVKDAGFYDAAIEVCLIIVKKCKPAVIQNSKYFYKHNGMIYMSPHSNEIREILSGSKRLANLSLIAKTGNVVWNQVKDKLVEKNTDGSKLLIYSSNITDSTLEIDNLNPSKDGTKKQYVKGLKKPTINSPVILVERGFGNSFSFSAIMITDMNDFYAENHVNVIRASASLPVSEQKEKLEYIMKSLKDPRTRRFLELFMGNGMLSASDLNNVLPIF